MQWLARICVKRPVFATVIILMLLVVGVFGYPKLGLDYFPKAEIPIVTVMTRMTGASPREVESQITDKMEGYINTISGIDELRSVSTEGFSILYVRFVMEKSVDVAAQEVRDKVNASLPELPQGIDQPVVSKVDPDSAPILQFALESNRPVKEITELADTVVRRQLESVNGVGQVTLIGGRKRQINVWMDPVRLRAYSITAPEVAQAITLQNIQIPGGSMDTGKQALNLRVLGRVTSADEVGRIILQKNRDNLVRVSDVARVEDGEKELETSALKDGNPTVVLSLRKQSGANTVETVDAVLARLDTIRKALPSDAQLKLLRDNSQVVRTSTNAVKEHLVLGALFAAIVVLLFLGNGRATLISSLAIPTSLIAAFGIMWLAGFTLNILTLLALALVVGIVIDDTIIVVEVIFKYIEEHKKPPELAAILGTKEVGMAVLATTLALIAVFAPAGFMSGMIGRFIKGFSFTMVFAISVSLLVSFTLTPALSARIFKGKGAFAWERKLEGLVGIFYHPLEKIYLRALAWCLGHRGKVLLACAFSVLCVVPLGKVVHTAFIPPSEDAEFEVSIRSLEGTNLGETQMESERIARAIRGMKEVQSTLVTVADDEQMTQNLGRIYVKLVDPSERKSSQEEMMEVVRQTILPSCPKGFRTSASEVPKISGTGMAQASLAYTLSGPNLEVLTEASKTILAEFKKVPGVVDADSTLVVGKPELMARVDRDKAGILGISVADLSNTLRMMVGGMKVTTLEEGGEQYDIRIRSERSFRQNVEGLSLYSVPSRELKSAPLASVVSLEDGTGPSVIRRLNRRREVTLSANVAPGYSEGAVMGALDTIVKAKNLPSAYLGEPSGRSKESARMGASFIMTFLLGFAFVYLILAAQFESWLNPLIILLTFPLTLPFSLLSLVIFRQSLNMFSILGLLVLFGVVMKNAILQIDHTNQLRDKGMERTEAILAANKDRLRPILMTTVAFVAGMLPMVFAHGIGAEMSKATSGVIVGGQILSLALTLLAIPTIYSVFDDAKRWAKLRVGRPARPEQDAEGPLVNP